MILLRFGLVFVLANFCMNLALADAERDANNKLIIVGSDTLSGLMTAWTQAFFAQNSGISVEVQAVGSAAAPPALQQGTANIGTMSRAMNSDELSAFMAETGRKPTEIVLAEDAVVFIAHPSNPVEYLTENTIARIFGMPGTCGTSGRIMSWEKVSASHPWGRERIQVLGRTATSGTYQYFRKTALCGGDPGIFINEIPGGAGVTNTVSRLPSSLAYSAMTHANGNIKVLNVMDGKGEIVSPDSSGYPFKRRLYMYLATSLDSARGTAECAFLEFIASAEGLELLRNSGFDVPAERNSLTLMGAANACR
ncbi:MAG: hypothetical protein DWQ28_04975 [Proteobacteria bacterium]|nr:MAG: hypothetical protein DWQ28_04975 [Pseudomonadota bacterium]